MVRLVQDYGINELPIQNFDSAIASEIAFSIWIRRRDAHSGNRAFAHGIPMFFDFHIAFGCETENFFRMGPGGGYVENWRLWRIESDTALKDIALLSYLEFDKNIAAIPIINKSHFETALFKFAGYIRDNGQKDLYKTVKEAGFSEERGAYVNKILQKSIEDIEASLNKVLYIFNQDNIGIFSEDYLKDYLKEKLVKQCSEEYQKVPSNEELVKQCSEECRKAFIGRGIRCYQENGLANTLTHLYCYFKTNIHRIRNVR